MRFFAKAFAAWLVLLVAMSANGFLRALALVPWLGESQARQVSSILGAAIVVTLAGLFVRRLPDPGSAPLVRTGIFWGLLTLAFEFGFGHYVAEMPWPELLADYDVTAGRLWPVVLLTTIAAPWLWGASLVRSGSSPAAS
jgi:hypothetical protein